MRRNIILAATVSTLALVITVYGQGCSSFKATQLSLTSGDSSLGSGAFQQTLTCDPGQRSTSDLGMRRLTKTELINSLTSLFGASVMNDSSVQTALSGIPAQQPANNTQFDNSIADVVGLEAAADAIVAVTFSNASTIDSVIGGCNTSDIATCTMNLINKFGLKAYRRPVPTASATSIRSLISSIGGVDGLKNAVTRMIISPYFTQMIEVGEGMDNCTSDCPAVSGTRIKLSQYEIATRLAFQLTGAPPDQTLLDAAAAGSLSSLPTLRTQGLRLLSLQSAHTNLKRVMTEYLDIKQVSDPNAVVGKSLGIDASGFGQEAFTDLTDYADYEVFTKQSDFIGLLTDKAVIPSTARLAQAYGVSQSSSAAKVTNGMGGLFLRPAVLMSANAVSSPILRGVFFQRKVLCNDIPSPDPNIVASRLSDLNSVNHLAYSNRDMITTVTAASACIGCHATINPIGFTMEKFGPFGTPRTIETIYDDNGPTSITHAIDTNVANLMIGSNPTPAADADTMVNAVANTIQAQRCFDRALIVNSRYRAVDTTDNCSLNEMTQLHNSGKPITELILQSAVNEGIFWKTAAGVQ